MGVAAKRLEGLLARVHEPRLWPIIHGWAPWTEMEPHLDGGPRLPGVCCYSLLCTSYDTVAP